MIVVAPTLRPVGGVVKLLDYAVHAADLGHPVTVASPDDLTAGHPLRRVPHLAGRLDGFRFVPLHRYAVGRDGLVLFSWPTHHDAILYHLDETTPMRRVIHLVQNTRHGNPRWLDGYATRLLARPMSRVMVSHEVLEACRPWLHPRSATRVIVEGHAYDAFVGAERNGLHHPVRVGYTTWKSEVGREVERLLHDDPGFAFRSIRTTVGWDDLADLYRWSDVFLGTPGPEEGFYLPGLEAMAAGAVVVISDAGGNRAYCRFGQNCLQVPRDDAPAYVAALRSLAADPARVASLRAAATATLGAHTLDRERAEFAAFLGEIG